MSQYWITYGCATTMASLQEVLDFHLHFLNSSKIFLKINPAWIFFLLLQWKSPFESANISDHSTRNLNRDIFFFITYSTLQRKFERSIDYRFVSNWKEKEKKKINGADRSIHEIKTRKFNFLLTCTKNNKVCWTFE